MNQPLQLIDLNKKLDTLHQMHGDPMYSSIYGAGKIDKPHIFLIFMNPTARNVSAKKDWQGLRAPWIGTKDVWRMLFYLGLFSNETLMYKIKAIKPDKWDKTLALQIYNCIAQKDVYITNIAKCTQADARALPNSVFRSYLPTMLEEIERIKPKNIITFGNQVSSILLSKPISVSNYINDEVEKLLIGDKEFNVYPTYYPVGQGMRNMPKAINRIKRIISNQSF
jgi:DNA polymerase